MSETSDDRFEPRGEWGGPAAPGYVVQSTRSTAELGVLGLPQPLILLRIGTESLRARSVDGAPLPATGVHEVVLKLAWRTIGPLRCDCMPHPDCASDVVMRLLSPSKSNVSALLDAISTLLARGVLAPSPTRLASRDQLHGKAMRRRLKALAGFEVSGRLVPTHGMPWPVELLEVSDDHLICSLIGPPPAPLFHVELEGRHAHYRFAAAEGTRLPSETRGAIRIQIPMPERVLVERRRWRRRATAPEGMVLAWRHPQWPAEPRVRRLRDVSTSGVGFWLWPEEDLLCPGMTLPTVSILFHGEVICEGRAQLRHLTARPPSLPDGGGEAVCGMSFEPGSPGDSARWRNVVHHLLSPRTRSGAVWSQHSWRVYQDSGYFHLSGKHPDQFNALQGAFREVNRGIDAAPWLGCQAVWPSDRGVEATFTFVRAYARTWFGYQLAKSPDRTDTTLAPPREVLRELYARVFEHMQHDEEMRWVAGYLEASVPWNQVAQFAWAAERLSRPDADRDLADEGTESGDSENTEDVCLVPFGLMEGRVSQMQAQPEPGVRIEDANDTALEALHAHLRTTRSAAWRSCLDLTPARFNLARIEAVWARAGLGRSRRCLCAWRGDTLLAAAVVETGETGASLFNLLDSVRLFALSADGEDTFEALLGAAARSYEALGKDVFVLYREIWSLDAALAAGLGDLGGGKLWAIRRHLLPDFLEHIAALLAPKPTKPTNKREQRSP